MLHRAAQRAVRKSAGRLPKLLRLRNAGRGKIRPISQAFSAAEIAASAIWCRAGA